MSQWVFWIATGLGAGTVPIAPGTAGSLVGLILVFLLSQFSPLVYIAFFILILGVGWYCAGQMERDSGQKDNPAIVIDEIVGMMITGFLIPPGIIFLLVGFLLFRLFDILKPFPANWIQTHLKGANGIMLDDAVCGVYANLILQIVWA